MTGAYSTDILPPTGHLIARADEPIDGLDLRARSSRWRGTTGLV